QERPVSLPPSTAGHDPTPSILIMSFKNEHSPSTNSCIPKPSSSSVNSDTKQSIVTHHDRENLPKDILDRLQAIKDNLLGLNVSLLNPHLGTAQSTDTLNKLVENPSTTTEQGSVTEDDNNT
ncbi:hypothetical protein AFCA_012197, partial [Aspergillus flavus]